MEKRMRLFRYGILALPLILLVMSMGATNAQAYWEYGNFGYYHRWGLGYRYIPRGIGKLVKTDIIKAFSDGSNNIAYDCSGHTSVYCASYGHGYGNGQTQYNNQNSWQPSQNQEQQQNSYSSAISNPNVRVIINNLPSNSNNSTAGVTAPTNSGPGEQNEKRSYRQQLATRIDFTNLHGIFGTLGVPVGSGLGLGLLAGFLKR